MPGYTLSKGILHCNARFDGRPNIVVPQTLIPTIYAFYHLSPAGAHLGVCKTQMKIRHYFISKGMDADVAAHVKACKVCGLSKPALNTHYGMLSSDVASRPLENLFLDFNGKFPRSESRNSNALVCVDAFSKFVWIFPVREASTVMAVKSPYFY
jgi:hypothetical protein